MSGFTVEVTIKRFVYEHGPSDHQSLSAKELALKQFSLVRTGPHEEILSTKTSSFILGLHLKSFR